MAISSVAGAPATSLPTVSSFSSTGSMTDIANQFSSLLANFSAAAGPGTQQAPSTGLPAAGSGSAPQSGPMLPGTAAYMFVSQTTTTTTTIAASAPAAEPPLFASIDTSGNGLIDRQEFVAKFGSNGSQGSASQLFNVLDRNGDSSIDGTELAPSQSASAASSPPSGSATAATPDGVNWSPSSLFLTLPGMQAASLPGLPGLPVFTRLDADQNGLLDQAEFAAAYGSNAGQAMTAFASVDGNGNGTVDWSELNNAQLSSAGSGPGISAGGGSSTSTTTTTSMFFAELIQLQAQLTTGTGGSSTGSDTGSGGSTTGGSAATGSTSSSTAGTPDTTTTPGSGGSSTADASSGGSASGSTAAGGSTTATTSGSTDPSSTVADATTGSSTGGGATSSTAADGASGVATDPASVIVDAAAGISTGSADAAQTVAALQSGLLDALDSKDGKTTSASSSTATA